MSIIKNKMVSLTYNLRLDGIDRELIEQTTEEYPLTFVYGAGVMFPAFEARLEGLEQGKSFDFKLSCGEAYGEIDENAIVDLPKHLFIVDGQFDDEVIKVGNTVPMMSTDGRRMNGLVLEMTEDTIVMDFNHPLAGEDLYFSGKILEVRDATEEEIAAAKGDCACGDGCGCQGNGCEHSSEEQKTCNCEAEGHVTEHYEDCACGTKGCSHRENTH